MRRTAVGLLLASSLGGCVDDREVWRPDVHQTRVEAFEVLPRSTRAIDILYVIDNSALMAPYEARMEQAFGDLGAMIQNGQRRWNDIHVGVVTADVDCDGVGSDADAVPWRSDPAMTNNRFLIDWRHADGTRTSNVAPGDTFNAVLSRLALAGHDGCGVSRPLEATRRAVADRQFRRSDTDLMVAIADAADESSTLDPTALAHAILTATPPAHSLNVEVIGAPAPRTSVRLRTFAESFSRGSASTLDSNIADTLAAGFATGWGEPLSDPCVTTTLVDLDPGTEGVQPNCDFRDEIRDRGTSQLVYSHPVPACSATDDGASSPCWRIEHDAVNCGQTAEQLRIDVRRPDFAPEGTHTIGQCESI